MVERNHQSLKYAREKELQSIQRAHLKQAGKQLPSGGKVVSQNFSRRQWQLQQIKKCQAQGIPIKATAQLLGMSRNTVKKYLHLKEPPRRKFSVQVNIALFDAYIRGRIEEEPAVQLMQLYREIKQRAYNGGRTSAFAHLHEYVKRTSRFTPPRLPDIFCLPSKVPFLLLRNKQQMTFSERKLVAGLCRKCPQIKTAYGLARELKELMEQKKGNLLQQWVSKAVASGVRELKGFAKGLLSDLEAVRNALSLPWSNGQVEGQINKLKTIKRQMYGRANFELLRKHLLLNTS